MSCGHIALEKAGIKVKKYFASEIKDIAIKVTKNNYPDTIHVGSVTEIIYKDGILHTAIGDFETDIDIVMFGSPCQSFSQAMKTDMRIGLEDKERSGLFLECYRVLKEVNPAYFLMENVESMKNDDRDFITQLMGIEPIMINSALVGACLRKRYYWTNIPNICELEDKGIVFQEILDTGWSNAKRVIHCWFLIVGQLQHQ